MLTKLSYKFATKFALLALLVVAIPVRRVSCFEPAYLLT